MACENKLQHVSPVFVQLSSQQIARRWRQCNPRSPPPFESIEDEDEWRTYVLELLTKAHTTGGANALSFEVVKTNYSDMAFSLESTIFSWRWECCFVGHKSSADIISKQLVFPLISMNHLLFTSAEPVQDMTDTDIEKAVDKLGRTSRRSVDTHIKNALSKPRVSTILRRTTAVFNSLHELPSIVSSVEEPSLQTPSTTSSKSGNNDFTFTNHTHDNLFSRDVEMNEPPRSHRPRLPIRISPSAQETRKSSSPAKADSATEESSSDEQEPGNSRAPPTVAQSQVAHQLTQRRSASPKVLSAQPSASPKPRSRSPQTSLAGSSQAASTRAKSSGQARGVDDRTSDDDSSPIKPPPKKAKPKQLSSSDSDSEAERKARVAELKGAAAGSGMGGGAAKRGVRQPIKRGGKRF